MTVGELIETLQQYPKDLPVVIYDENEGTNWHADYIQHYEPQKEGIDDEECVIIS